MSNVNIKMLHVDINKFHVNIRILNIDIIYLRCMEGAEVCHHTLQPKYAVGGYLIYLGRHRENTGLKFQFKS